MLLTERVAAQVVRRQLVLRSEDVDLEEGVGDAALLQDEPGDARVDAVLRAVQPHLLLRVGGCGEGSAVAAVAVEPARGVARLSP